MAAQTPFFDSPLSPRIANYDINVMLDSETKILTGNEKLTWKNPSADTIRELYFHLYLNAFSNNKSTWLSEAGGVPNHAWTYEKEENIWGYCEMQKITDEKDNDLTNTLIYSRLEDQNEYDKTVAVITLTEPILPYKSMTLDIDFSSKLPRAMVRTGYSKNYHFVVQWFPKVGVYEAAGVRCQEVGQWNCNQYHRSTEYYADFGVYDVKINAPSDFIIGASGQLLEKNEENGRTTHQYRAEDVIDFAWTASPDFIEKKEDWKGVDVRILTHSEHESLYPRIKKTLFFTLDYFAEKFEKYPYPTLTLVVTPFHGIMTSSMEYPTLYSVPAVAHMPEGMKFSETLTVHEFVHQYFMQMVATNEQEEAWLDEGITNFYEGKIMDALYGKQSSSVDFMGYRYGNIESNRNSYFGMSFPQIAPNSIKNWEFPAGASHDIQYSKTTLWLKTLEGIVGQETFDEIMKTYFLKWKFKHPCGQDFIDVANAIVVKKQGDKFGENLNWFFDQVVHGTSICDYEVGYIQHRKIHAPTGIFEDKNQRIMAADADQSLSGLEASVLVYRSGDMQLPVEVLVRFEDGTEVLENWDGIGRSTLFKYDKWIESAVIDPERKIYLDKNLLNNNRSRYPETTGLKKYAQKFLFYLQNVMVTVGGLV